MQHVLVQGIHKVKGIRTTTHLQLVQTPEPLPTTKNFSALRSFSAARLLISVSDNSSSVASVAEGWAGSEACTGARYRCSCLRAKRLLRSGTGAVSALALVLQALAWQERERQEDICDVWQAVVKLSWPGRIASVR